MSDFSIENPERLRWLVVVLAAVAVIVYGALMRGRAMRAFASVNLIEYLTPSLSRARRHLKAVLVLAAMGLIVVALAGPRWGTYLEPVQQRQLDLMICLDVSKSMLAEDAGMSRLDRARDDIKRLLDMLAGASIGLVTFAGRADLACPLTDDYEYYRIALDDVGIHSARIGGTNLGEAIAAAREAFGEPRPRDRAIILLTDGEDHGGMAVDEALAAREAGMVVYAIGIGDAGEGALIPTERDGRRTFLKYNEQQVWSKLNPGHLHAIAVAGGGEYHPSGQVMPTQRTLEWIYAEKLAPLQRQAESQRHVERRQVRFHWFVGLALALLVVESVIGERRRREKVEWFAVE